MPESKAHALKRAKAAGFPASNVVKGSDGYYIAPRGLKTSRAKHTYAELRSHGRSKESAAKIAHSVDK